MVALRDQLKQLKETAPILIAEINDILMDPDYSVIESVKEGEIIPRLRFIPSYLDRQSYSEIVLSLPISNDDFVTRSKAYFDSQIAEMDVNQIKSIYNNLLKLLSLVTVKFPESQEFLGCQIYQWFFEKSLMAEKFFVILNPGVKHRVIDLAKNYLLSFFMSDSQESQTNVYITHWIPFEKRISEQDFCKFIISNTKSIHTNPFDLYLDFAKWFEYSLESISDHMPHIIEFLDNFPK